MEAGRDKSNKNKIEANDPEMLAGLAEAIIGPRNSPKVSRFFSR